MTIVSGKASTILDSVLFEIFGNLPMIRLVKVFSTGLTIVGYDHHTLGSISSFAMISWNWVLEKFCESKCMYIDFVKHIFHVVEINKVFWILEVSHNCGDPGGHFFRIDHSNLSVPINHIVTQKQLLGLVMNHPGSWGTSHTFPVKSHG